MNINDIFIQFLEDHGCKEQYLANKAKDKGYPDLRTDDNLFPMKLYLTDMYRFPFQLISAAFVWACTPEGNDYWRDIEREWKSCVKQNQLDI